MIFLLDIFCIRRNNVDYIIYFNFFQKNLENAKLTWIHLLVTNVLLEVAKTIVKTILIVSEIRNVARKVVSPSVLFQLKVIF